MRSTKFKVSGYLLIALVMVLSFAFSPSVEALQIRIWDGVILHRPIVTIYDNNIPPSCWLLL